MADNCPQSVVYLKETILTADWLPLSLSRIGFKSSNDWLNTRFSSFAAIFSSIV